MTTFNLRSTPLTLAAQSGRTPATVIKQKNQNILIPAFEVVDIPAWPGSSYVAARVSLTVGVAWSIVMPIVAGGNYCPAIYFNGTRYKLIENVGETLAYPLYAGQPLPATEVILEFWTVNDNETVMSQTTDWYLPMALLTLPVDWIDSSTAIYLTASTPTPTEIPYV